MKFISVLMFVYFNYLRRVNNSEAKNFFGPIILIVPFLQDPSHLTKQKLTHIDQKISLEKQNKNHCNFFNNKKKIRINSSEHGIQNFFPSLSV